MAMRSLMAKFVAVSLLWGVAIAGAQPSEQQVRNALDKAVRFFRTKVSVKGSYLWRYSADLAKRWGEE